MNNNAGIITSSHLIPQNILLITDYSNMVVIYLGNKF